MDGRHFDALVKSLAAQSRRRLLRVTSATALAALLGRDLFRAHDIVATPKKQQTSSVPSPPDSPPPPPSSPTPPPCAIDCAGKVCGADDGCGGKCQGSCPGVFECISGVCQDTCPLTRCSGVCVDLTSDKLHCGWCGRRCDSDARFQCCNSNCSWIHGCMEGATLGEHCRAVLCGSCTPCPELEYCCEGQCVDREADPNCGVCGLDCPSALGPEYQCCSGVCRNLMFDNEHCGRCGFSCIDQGFNCCDGLCVDVNTDNLNCGLCGRACDPSQFCDEGICNTFDGGGDD